MKHTNKSTMVFIYDQSTRLIKLVYDPEREKDFSYGKTDDPHIQPGQYVVVRSKTRHKLTVSKVAEVDLPFDPSYGGEVQRIVGVVGMANLEAIEAKEEQALEIIQAADLRAQREELQETVLKHATAELRELGIMKGPAQIESAAPPPHPLAAEEEGPL